MYFLGIDVSKGKSDYLLMDEFGQKKGKSFPLENSKSGVEALLEKLSSLNIFPQDTLAGMEATGPFWANLYNSLAKKGIKVVLLNPYQTRRYQQAISNKIKTDSSSAFVIADLLRSRRYLACRVPEEKVESLRELVKFQHQQGKAKRSLIRRIASILQVVFPEYEKTPLANLCGIATREILKRWPTAADIASTSPKRIEKVVRSIKGNNFPAEKIEGLVKTAADSIYSGRAKDARSLALKSLLAELETVLSSLAEVTEKIEKIFSPEEGNGSSFPGENLLSIPGVGKKTIAAFLAVTGFQGEYFPSTNELTGFIGFYPKIDQSGKSKKESCIARQGPRFLRHSLYITAVSCIRHNLELKALYNKKISQGKSPKEALIYVAKKLAHIMLALAKSGEQYRPERVFVPPTALCTTFRMQSPLPSKRLPNFQRSIIAVL